mmetsp:Transcript_35189/g.92187  ORF Transcript_35189/g.92187 Transcript_35189/m.92187 type:complete len:228 (+) Transcript_35189:2286-2969(+)
MCCGTTAAPGVAVAAAVANPCRPAGSAWLATPGADAVAYPGGTTGSAWPAVVGAEAVANPGGTTGSAAPSGVCGAGAYPGGIATGDGTTGAGGAVWGGVWAVVKPAGMGASATAGAYPSGTTGAAPPGDAITGAGANPSGVAAGTISTPLAASGANVSTVNDPVPRRDTMLMGILMSSELGLFPVAAHSSSAATLMAPGSRCWYRGVTLAAAQLQSERSPQAGGPLT